MSAKKITVLFLCTGNSCRSQMAEAFLKHYAGDRFDVYSAGLEPASEIHPMTIQVMAEKGLSLSGQRPKGIMTYLGRLPATQVIVVCSKAARTCPTSWPFPVQMHDWPFEDPASFEGDQAATLSKFREIRDLIDRRIKEWIDKSPAA
jgi:arsenate reductase